MASLKATEIIPIFQVKKTPREMNTIHTSAMQSTKYFFLIISKIPLNNL